MPLLTWWRNDPLPQLTSGLQLSIAPSEHIDQLAALTNLRKEIIRERLAAKHTPYLAHVGQIPVAYGWVARRDASIGELAHEFQIPPDTRYLWDFATLLPWRGYGIYPNLLQAIVTQEHADRFWIIHAPENSASARGIRKAGFQVAGFLSFQSDGLVGFAEQGLHLRTVAGAQILGLPTLNAIESTKLTPCWYCTLAIRQQMLKPEQHVAHCTHACSCGDPHAGHNVL